MTNTNPLNTPPQKPKSTNAKTTKLPIIICGVSIAFLIVILIFALFQNSKLKSERNEAVNAYKQTQVIPNECQEGTGSICLYGKTSAVDDYLMILSRTLQVKPSTSYDIMIEVVPSKLASDSVATTTDCRPNNHHLYICQRMTSSTPKKLIESLLGSYDNLNPNMVYNVSLIMKPRVTLIADDSQPENLQMAPTTTSINMDNQDQMTQDQQIEVGVEQQDQQEQEQVIDVTLESESVEVVNQEPQQNMQ